MRPAVEAAWTAHVAFYEGVTSWMYLDTKAKVTTGTGNLIDSVAAAQALPWFRKDGARATPAEVETEWRRVKSKTDWTRYNGLMAVWRDSATLNLKQSTIEKLLFAETARHWEGPKRVLPALESWPADAQLALLDLAWQNGPEFLTGWNDTRAALQADDFAKAAAVLKGSLKDSPRTRMRVRLLTNAATVRRIGADPAVLWGTRTPTPLVEEFPMAANVPFRGGRTCSCVATSLPWVELDMLRLGLIQRNIDIMQMIGTYGASAGTHSQGGCVDVAQRSPAQIRVWRKWGWTQQERIGVGSGPHAHGWPYRCPHLSPAARAQENDWDRRDAGLVGSAAVVGPWPVKDWKTALRENKVALLDDVRKAAREGAEEAIRKGIDVKAVWESDVLGAPEFAIQEQRDKGVAEKDLNKTWKASSFLRDAAYDLNVLRKGLAEIKAKLNT